MARKTSGGGLLALVRAKRYFLTQVFATLVLQLAVALLTMHLLKDSPWVAKIFEPRFLYLLVVVLPLLLLVFVLAAIPMPVELKMVLFTVISFGVGLLLTRLAKRYGDGVVRAALAGTTAMFAVLIVVGGALAGAGVDLAPLSIYLFTALMALVVASVVMLFVKVSSLFQRVFSTLIVILFSIYVVFDTNMILQRDYAGDFVEAALDYFFDFINIFQNLAILGGGGE